MLIHKTILTHNHAQVNRPGTQNQAGGMLMLTYHNTFQQYADIVSVKEMQQMLNIGKNKALELLSNGKIEYIRIGRIYKIPKNSIIDFLNNNSIKN